MEENIIEIKGLKKIYNLYDNPKDRVLEAFKIGRKKRFTEFMALDNVSFNVAKGETVGIIGTNGAGKSTLLKIITGVLNPSAGEVNIKGKVSALLELGTGFNEEYTGIENIFLNGRMMGYNRKEMEGKLNGIVEFADIGEFIEQPVKTYSSGMFARLAFAVAINVEPDILIVDEALSVGDIFFQNKCFKKFEELKEKGTTILFVSHDIESVRQMCSRVLWLNKGQTKAFGEASKICDMYMDEKRKNTEYVAGHIHDEAVGDIFIKEIDETRKYPIIENIEDRFENDKVMIKSVFFEDAEGQYANTLHVDQEYTAHVVIECLQEVENLIIGFVLETKKGLPLFDINNFINQGEVVKGKQGQILEIVYRYTLPRILNGMYLVGAAVAQGTQSKHEMLTWLHAVRQVEVVNPGYNSS
ncbi:MAG: ABC transporter ATP-binding protein, partial [Lachnospiraceae bacterium]|nr:ABC transporter ATP-binding protein [Lachnospiraceae bacterium]